MNKYSSEARSNIGIEENDGVLELREIIYKYLRYWKWILLFTIFCLAAGFLINLVLTRKYEVSTSVLLKEDDARSRGSNSPLASLQDLGLISTTSNVYNEIAVFSSPNLLKQVVESLELYTEYYEKGIFRNVEAYKASPYYVSTLDLNLDNLEGMIEFSIGTKEDGTLQVAGQYITVDDELEINQVLDKLPGYIELPAGLGRLFITNRPDGDEEKKEKDYKIVIRSPRKVAYGLTKSIEIAPTNKQSSVLNIKLTVQNVTKGVDILNELVKIYNKNNVADNNEMAVNTSQFIDTRLVDISKELESVENDVERYKKGQGIADLGSEAQSFITQTSEIDKKRTEIETQLRTVDLVEQIIDDKGGYKMIPTFGMIDDGLVRIISNYNNQLLTYNQLERSTTEDSPIRKDAELQLQEMKASIKSSVANVKRAMSISQRETNRQVAEISSRIVSVPTQQRELVEIMRQQEIKQSLYLFLMRVKEETNITMASNSAKAKLITDPLIPDGPVSPRLKVILLGSILFALLASMIAIYIKDLMQLNIVGREELERLSEVKILGTILSRSGGAHESVLVVEKGKTTPIVELFRALRNNVQFMLNGSDKKVILVTSTMSGEGKTFISSNLAASFSLSNKKVLLIGGDIRRPRLAVELNIQKENGLTSYLSGSVKDWKSLLSPIPKYSNFDVLQAGIVPPNPNESLMSPHLNTLIEEAKEIYDVIVIDSAPVGIVSDTFLLSSFVDVTIYVARENVTPKNAMIFVNDIYENDKLPNMFIILNDVSEETEKARHGRYGYGKTYGYTEG